MSDNTGFAPSKQGTDQTPSDILELATELSEVRRQLSAEVKLRRDVIKPIEQALRALKDPHRNAVALYEATVALEKPPDELALPENYSALVGGLRALADEKISGLEFTFARDLRATFEEIGFKLEGPPSELIADLFVIKVDMRKRQMHIQFSRQPATRKAIKLDVDQVVAAYERARREICERETDLEELLKELFEAYERTLSASRQTGGLASKYC